MNLGNDGYKILHDVQRKCNELNRKIDSIIRIMEMLTTYLQYSSLMSEFQSAQGTDAPAAGLSNAQRLWRLFTVSTGRE